MVPGPTLELIHTVTGQPSWPPPPQAGEESGGISMGQRRLCGGGTGGRPDTER